MCRSISGTGNPAHTGRKKELKGFAKISLEPGQQREVVIDLDRRAFSFWDSGSRSWVLEAGDFDILAGASASDIRLDGSIRLENGDDVSDWAAGLRDAVPGYFEPTIRGFADLSSSGDFARLMNRPLPPKDIPPGSPSTGFQPSVIYGEPSSGD